MILLAVIITVIIAGVVYARMRFSRAQKECEALLDEVRECAKHRREAAEDFLTQAERYPVRERESMKHIREMLAYPNWNKNISVEVSLESALGILMKGLSIEMDSYPYIYEDPEYQKVRTNLLAELAVLRMKVKPYNEKAEEFNALLDTFGYNFVAEGFKIARMPEFETEENLVLDYKVAF